MKIAIVGINYAPEPTGIAPYTTGLANGLAERGHQVVVLTGYPHYPYWKRRTPSAQFRSAEAIDDVRVQRYKHPIPQSHSWFRRAAMEFLFGLQIVTTRWSRPDVLICVTPPLLAAAMSTVRARLTWRRPAVGILIQDMYGRGVVETGAASGISAQAVGMIESFTLRAADGVSVIHRGFAQDLTDDLNIDIRKIREIRNWTHITNSDPSASAEFRHAHGWSPNDIVVLHAGNMGYKQGLENVVAAAVLAERNSSPVRFVLLGDGNQRSTLEEQGSGLSALQFLSPVSDQDFPAALGAADVLLVNERPGVAHMSVPSKLTSYFTAGKPILAASNSAGFTAGEIAAAGAGVCVPADRPDLLLEKAVQLGSDREAAARMGDAGRHYCRRVLGEDAALDRYERWVLDLANMQRNKREGT